MVFLRGFGGVNGDLVVRGVAAFHAEVEIFQIDVEIGVDQLVLDHLPDDPGHFVPVHFNDWIFDFDFLHGISYRTFGAYGKQRCDCAV